LKPTYDECTLKWRVKGIGLFDTPQEAWNAIRDNTNDRQLNVMVNRKLLNDMHSLAKDNNISISDFVRQAIRKEVERYGK
jgi:hypothetical protein